MTRKELENLVQIGSLKPSSVAKKDISTLIQSGLARLEDAKNKKLRIDSRFDLAYNAAHALSLSALWINGYSADSRYIVFQCLPHTLDLSNGQRRVLDKAHHVQNVSEYDGRPEFDECLVESVVQVCDEIAARISAIPDKNELFLK